MRVAGACGEAEQACAEARTAKALGFDAVLPVSYTHLDVYKRQDKARSVTFAMAEPNRII